jgi:hypothetical protein
MIKLNYKNTFLVLLSSIFLYGCGSDGGDKEAFYYNPDYPLQRDIRHIEQRSDRFWRRQEMRKDCYEHVYQNWWNFIMR